MLSRRGLKTASRTKQTSLRDQFKILQSQLLLSGKLRLYNNPLSSVPEKPRFTVLLQLSRFKGSGEFLVIEDLALCRFEFCHLL